MCSKVTTRAWFWAAVDSEAVDLAGHAAGLGVHHFDGVGFEQLHLVGGTGAVEPVQPAL